MQGKHSFLCIRYTIFSDTIKKQEKFALEEQEVNLIRRSFSINKKRVLQ